MTKPTSIDDLPVELLNEIITLAADDRPDSEKVANAGARDLVNSSNDIKQNKNYSLYKSLRLVCKLWLELATPLLFESIVLLSHLQSWKNLDNICTTQNLAKHVREIQLATVPHLPAHGTFKTWQEDKGMTFEVYDVLRQNIEPFDKTTSDSTDRYENYKKWRAAETKMRRYFNRGGIPELRLKPLRNLQSVSTIGHRELAVIMHVSAREALGGDQLDEWWPDYPYISRREMETGLQDRVDTILDVDSSHLEMFIRAINNAGVDLESLNLRRGKELLRCGSQFDTALMRLDSLRSLVISVGDIELYSAYGRPAEYRISPWLRTLRNLKELSIYHEPLSGYPDIFILIGGVHFPTLSKVHLDGVSTTYSRLMAFLDMHRVSIQSLTIIDPQMNAACWVRFCAKERGRAWKAQGKRLRLTDIKLEEIDGAREPSGADIECS